MSQNSGQTWLLIGELTERLYCSERTIYNLREADLIVAGKDFYAAGATGKGAMVYCLENVRDALKDQTARRQKERIENGKKLVTYDQEHLAQLTERTNR